MSRPEWGVNPNQRRRSVYVIRSETGRVKVGVSDRPSLRLLQLRHATGLPLSLEFSAEADRNAAEWEKRAHAILAESHLGGEWFAVESDKAVAAVLRASDELGLTLGPTPSLAELRQRYSRRTAKPVAPAQIAGPRKQGRPITGVGVMTGIRFRPDDLAMLDAWIAEQPEPRPTRPQAIRRLVMGVLGLSGRVPKKDESK